MMKRPSSGAFASSSACDAVSQLSNVGSTPSVPADWEKLCGSAWSAVSAAAPSAYPALLVYFERRFVLDCTSVMFSTAKATCWCVCVTNDWLASAEDGPITSRVIFVFAVFVLWVGFEMY